MRYKVFGRHTGLKVSELVLGTAVFGTGWGHGAEADEARRMFDTYAEAGGNFVDTADGYQLGQSEEMLGAFLEGRRDNFVLATKFSLGGTPDRGFINAGNSRRSMVASVERSLRRLKTDRIDLYWSHMADAVTPTEEIVRAFDDLVRAGKILYAGLSNFPAWRVARAATIAELRGLAPIAALQVEHSLIERTTEYDLLPMGQALGLAIVAWSPLGGGTLTGKYRRGEQGRLQGFGRVIQTENSPQRTAVIDTLLALAKEIGKPPSQVAIAWVAAKGALPIIGPRTVEQLKDNLAAVDVELSAEHVARLDEVSAPPAVYPYTMLHNREYVQRVTGNLLDKLDLPATPVA
jgi:aryl-alcohol dehydrogenase-like predicted oxidoreductase